MTLSELLKSDPGMTEVESMLHNGSIDQTVFEAYNLLWHISTYRYTSEFSWWECDMSVVKLAWESIRIGRYNGPMLPKYVSVNYSHYTYYTLHCYQDTGRCRSWFDGKVYSL